MLAKYISTKPQISSKSECFFMSQLCLGGIAVLSSGLALGTKTTLSGLGEKNQGLP